MSSDDCKNKKDFWIETKFAQSSEVYQVILKRRADNDREPNHTNLKMGGRIIDSIKVEYFDQDEWKSYKDGALLPTN